MTTLTTYPFPSTRWSEAVAEAARSQEDTFRKLGFIDASVGIEVLPGDGLATGRAFVLTFGAYALESVREVPSPEGVDFTLRAPFGVWREMIQNIKENQGADLHHTLNYLHFGALELNAADQLKADLFFRVNGSLQAFFDASATIETDFGG